ncbi:MAG: hypothetical protein GY880_15815 [Planctomycetaceae bacterium]|nr:hypothetical protein [Planctomycetaceae bacterium]MCP4775699.1 hypothetical protein [Planctomycetaceae bacterium]
MFAKIVEQPARFEFLSYLGLGYLEDSHCFYHGIVVADLICMERLKWYESERSLVSNLRSEYEAGIDSAETLSDPREHRLSLQVVV